MSLYYFPKGDPGTTKHRCPEGFYCPNGTGWNWKACPDGTYSNQKQLEREQDCTPCDGGRFCRGVNLTAPSNKCSAGYYCVSGAATPNPYRTNLTQCPAFHVHITVGGICPTGHFCKEGSAMYEGTAGDVGRALSPFPSWWSMICSVFSGDNRINSCEPQVAAYYSYTQYHPIVSIFTVRYFYFHRRDVTERH